jgi:hypothetical protein
MFMCSSGGTFSKPQSDCKCITPPPAGVVTDGSKLTRAVDNHGHWGLLAPHSRAQAEALMRYNWVYLWVTCTRGLQQDSCHITVWECRGRMCVLVAQTATQCCD